ncbi:MAG: sulfatase-like hydrolase/transferase, partial [Deltaproteobacteria bacterium]|nr:sulfatase-like hydrolase/transferase [Deltaproteobacteria bacterium]
MGASLRTSPKRGHQRRGVIVSYVLNRTVALVLIFVTSVAFPGCRRKRLPGAPKNVILLVLDTTRADHVAPIGKRARTPNLRRMAREGTTFTRAYSHIPITGPSHSSMFTSLYPCEHGVLNNGQNLS